LQTPSGNIIEPFEQLASEKQVLFKLAVRFHSMIVAIQAAAEWSARCGTLATFLSKHQGDNDRQRTGGAENPASLQPSKVATNNRYSEVWAVLAQASGRQELILAIEGANAELLRARRASMSGALNRIHRDVETQHSVEQGRFALKMSIVEPALRSPFAAVFK
jgi:hypothetical protein